MIGRILQQFKLTAVAAFITVASLLLIATQFSHLPFSRPPLGVHNPQCESRHNNSHRRITSSSLQPSPYFHSKLRQYESLHSRCGPLSKYLVYTPCRGLGNRILGLASTFLYALLTNRVLLVKFGPNMEHLFCEPFPNSTWMLPETFPLRNQFHKSSFRDVYSYGNLLKKWRNGKQDTTIVQLFLHDKYDDYDKLFFKDENQGFLHGVPWLVLISNVYFVPSIFQMLSFTTELERLFPDEEDVESVFHHLGNYLFNPSNQAWKLITGFYRSHLAKAEERIGLQVRVFKPEKTPFPFLMKQILSCIQNQRIMTQLQLQPSKAILVASLSSQFYREMKLKYGTNVTGVYQASHEEKQESWNDSHNMKAWVDMYLLSLSNVLVTSSMSTFGYVAAGLGGIRPWIVMFPRDFIDGESELPEPACVRAVNVEPCFHVPPRFAYPGRPATVGRVIHCEDRPWGLKLAARHYNQTTN
ncbi:Fucosyltransferase 2 [Linum perenne]